jgi:ssDNA-binding Zn-finger/Zn-ribbon topoisomerase 1
MDLFLRREYPTSKWLVETSERCEKCGKRMFLRIVGNIKYLACEDCVRKDGHCKNYKKIDEVKS